MKNFPDSIDSVFFDWGKIWGGVKINVPSQCVSTRRYRFIHTLKYILFLARNFVSIIFQRLLSLSLPPLPPRITPLEMAQRHKFVSRRTLHFATCTVNKLSSWIISISVKRRRPIIDKEKAGERGEVERQEGRNWTKQETIQEGGGVIYASIENRDKQFCFSTLLFCTCISSAIIAPRDDVKILPRAYSVHSEFNLPL